MIRVMQWPGMALSCLSLLAGIGMACAAMASSPPDRGLASSLVQAPAAGTDKDGAANPSVPESSQARRRTALQSDRR